MATPGHLSPGTPVSVVVVSVSVVVLLLELVVLVVLLLELVVLVVLLLELVVLVVLLLLLLLLELVVLVVLLLLLELVVLVVLLLGVVVEDTVPVVEAPPPAPPAPPAPPVPVGAQSPITRPPQPAARRIAEAMETANRVEPCMSRIEPSLRQGPRRHHPSPCISSVAWALRGPCLRCRPGRAAFTSLRPHCQRGRARSAPRRSTAAPPLGPAR